MNIYTYKQIIVALREEYLNIQKQVDGLKQYVEANKIIDDYRFKLSVNKGLNISKLFLEFETKQKAIRKVLQVLLGGTFNNTFIFDLTFGFKEHYEFNQSEECDCYFKINDEISLNNKITELLNSDYIKEKLNNKDYVLPIEETGEKYFGFNWEQGTRIVDAQDPYYSDFQYNILDDYFIVRNNKKKIIDINKLYGMLNYKINIQKLDDYYKNIITNASEKEIVIDADFTSFEDYLSVVTTPKELILTNKK